MSENTVTTAVETVETRIYIVTVNWTKLGAKSPRKMRVTYPRPVRALVLVTLASSDSDSEGSSSSDDV